MLNKKYRLTKNGSFSYLYSKGAKVSAKRIKFSYAPLKSGIKIDFSVNNKIGKAVVRNLVKRRMRAITAEFLDKLKPCQAVFIAYKGIDELDFTTLREQMEHCFVRAGLIKANGEENKQN